MHEIGLQDRTDANVGQLFIRKGKAKVFSHETQYIAAYRNEVYQIILESRLAYSFD